MKIILTLLLATGFLFACNSGSDNGKNTATDTAAENHKEHGEQATKLVLNNGVKWKADSTTLLNVALLQKIVSTTKKGSLEDYMQTAAQLQEGLTKMVNECKMKGHDHDALHQWLEPLMEKTKELENATTVEHAATILNEVDNHINLFAQYFEK